MGTRLSDDEVVGAGLERVAELIAYMVPFVSLAPLPIRDIGPPAVHAKRRRRYVV